MRVAFHCSLLYNGVLGGALYVTDDTIEYITQKIFLEEAYRHLILRKEDMQRVSWKGWLCTRVTFHMNDGKSYSFLVFRKKAFLRALEQFRR